MHVNMHVYEITLLGGYLVIHRYTHTPMYDCVPYFSWHVINLFFSYILICEYMCL